eukprot:gene44164-biopygen30258
MNFLRFTRNFSFRQTMLLITGSFILVALGVAGDQGDAAHHRQLHPG